MKKKFLTFILCICFIIPAIFCLSACTQTPPDIQFKVENGYVQYYNGESWSNLIAIADLEGEDGDDADVWTIENDGYWYKNGVKQNHKAVGDVGEDGNGIKSIVPSTDPAKTNATQTTYLITLDDNSTYELVVKNGTNGNNADVWTIGADGYWYKNNIKTDDKAIGEDGDEYTIGSDGYWYLNGVKTEYKAIGEDATYTTHTVTFDYNDEGFANAVGKTISEYYEYSLQETLNYSSWLGDKLPTFENTVLKNYFDGWVVKDTDKNITAYDVIGGNITLQAKWKYDFEDIFKSNLPSSWFHEEYIYRVEGDELDSAIEELYIPALYVDSSNKIKKVQQLGNSGRAKINCANIKKVYIAPGVKAIQEAFSGSSTIDIYFPDNFVNMLSYVDNDVYKWAFSNYNGLINFHFTEIDYFYNSIGTNTLYANNYGRYNVYVDEKIVTKIDYSYNTGGDYLVLNRASFLSALSGCESIEIINFDETINNIRENTFVSMSNLKSVKFEANTVKIGNSAFFGCSELRKVSIPNGSVEIGEFAFCMCSKLESIEVSFGIDKLGASAFENCIKLSTIKLSENITTINSFVSNSIRKCYLEEIVITSSVTSIQSQAFRYCDYLTNVTIESADIYNSVTGNNGTYLLNNALEIKVLKSIVDDASNTNEFLNSTENYTKSSNGKYYIYTKVA